jgi:hypothetical protein
MPVKKLLGTAAAEQQARKEREAYNPHNSWHRIGAHRPGGTTRLVRRNPGHRCAFMAKVVCGVVQTGFRDSAGLLGKLRQMVMSEIARLHRSRRECLRDPTGFTFIDAFEPRHL